MSGWPASLKVALLLALGLLLLLLVLGPGRGPFSLRLLRLYPKKLGSAFAGWAARQPVPRFLRPALLGGFAAQVGADLKEADRPVEDFETLQDLFTRRLRPGLRPQDPPVPGFLNSPVDARIVAAGRITEGCAIQAKGLPYRIPELLKHDPRAQRFEGGHYLVLYLAPKDYHRIHVPLEGRVTALSRVEGELWPVNEASTAHTPRLYERNRRATWTATGTGPDEGLEVAAVLVGATHVGGVLLDAKWREGRPLPKDGGMEVPGLPCAPGEDLGTFAFGSTVVLLVGGPRAERWTPLRADGDVRVGQRLGSY
ncbi:MAG: phosphatidylserine decarboxylase [Acidobacteria bacterium]|nr:phosphatidylserine decarboxylase [Acidobacteriota bacterium]